VKTRTFLKARGFVPLGEAEPRIRLTSPAVLISAHRSAASEPNCGVHSCEEEDDDDVEA
jgi:hypothetical protein